MVNSFDADNVLPFPGVTTLDLDPALVLAQASKLEFTRVTVIGITADGEEYRSCSVADGGVLLWDMERAKHALMKTADDLL